MQRRRVSLRGAYGGTGQDELKRLDMIGGETVTAVRHKDVIMSNKVITRTKVTIARTVSAVRYEVNNNTIMRNVDTIT